MSQTTFPGRRKCFRWCLWRYFLEKSLKNHVFSCLLITVGIPIVNACTVASLYRSECFCEGDELEVSSSNFMNSQRKITSDGAITIYVPRAFQRAVSRPLIRHYVETSAVWTRPGRNPGLCNIRSGWSSHEKDDDELWMKMRFSSNFFLLQRCQLNLRLLF